MPFGFPPEPAFSFAGIPSQCRLSAAGIAFDDVKAIGWQPAAQNFVQAGDARFLSG
jgi:hypothetical protein